MWLCVEGFFPTPKHNPRYRGWAGQSIMSTEPVLFANGFAPGVATSRA
jgi:hypothetical protein